MTRDTRLVVSQVNPSGRQIKELTDFERKTDWRYSITATSIGRIWGVAGSHQPQFLDVLHRDHADVEDRVRTNKATVLHNFPPKSCDVNRGWMLTVNLAANLDGWVRLLSRRDVGNLADAEIDTMRFRLYHLPARLTDHARRRLRIEATWP
jgi:hypothetical protein